MADQIRDNILSDLSKAPRQTKPQPTPNYDLSKLPKDLRGKLTEKGEIINNLNHDLLTIGNTHPIKEDWIKHNATAAKVLAIKIEDAINAIDKMTIQREPKKILIHVSTNHFSSHKSDEINDRNMEQAKSALEELLGTLDRKFPTSEIYVSELFLRGERSMGKYVREMNSYIKLACQNRSQYTALRHSDNIDLPKHLKDDKHLSYIGFYIFLRNIRTQMYGMTPHYKPSNPHYNRSGPNQHRR